MTTYPEQPKDRIHTMKTNNTQKGALMNTNTIKKNMLRYKTETRPGLVALYDIRPGNGAGPFLQPRSPHGAVCWVKAQYFNH